MTGGKIDNYPMQEYKCATAYQHLVNVDGAATGFATDAFNAVSLIVLVDSFDRSYPRLSYGGGYISTDDGANQPCALYGPTGSVYEYVSTWYGSSAPACMDKAYFGRYGDPMRLSAGEVYRGSPENEIAFSWPAVQCVHKNFGYVWHFSWASCNTPAGTNQTFGYPDYSRLSL